MKILVGDDTSKIICTTEEIKVLAMMAEGMPPKTACATRGLSYTTFRSKFLGATEQIKSLEEQREKREKQKNVYRTWPK